MNWFPSLWGSCYIKLVTHLDKKSKFTQVIFVTENRVSYINTPTKILNCNFYVVVFPYCTSIVTYTRALKIF